MKVCLVVKHGFYDTSHTGKGHFALRLIDAFKRLNITIATPAERSDIDLSLGRWHYKPKATKRVIRLGAAHIDKRSDYKALNKRKWKSVKRADAVVYQSKFSQKLCEKFIGWHPTSRIILNGADQMRYIDLKPWASPYTINFCAIAREWTPQKRLWDIVKSFSVANINDSCLWVAGKVPKKYKNGNVYYVGEMNERQLGRIYKRCKAFIHLTPYDACPNAVVEALCAGCNIITNNMCGAAELSENALYYNYPEWNFKSVNFKKLPKIKHELVARLIRASVDLSRPENGHLSIDVIARQYRDFFEELLSGRSTN